MTFLAFIVTLGAGGWTVLVLFANSMRSSPGEFKGTGTLMFAWGAAMLMWIATLTLGTAHGAYERVQRVPSLVVGETISDRLLYGKRSYRSEAPLNLFGVYSRHYMHRRWKRMCKGPERYDAMREAYERGLPMPCGN